MHQSELVKKTKDIKPQDEKDKDKEDPKP
ncbi:unnamed protein product, partial [Allacma fusca]